MDETQIQNLINRLEKARQDNALTPQHIREFLVMVLGFLKLSKVALKKATDEAKKVSEDTSTAKSKMTEDNKKIVAEAKAIQEKQEKDFAKKIEEANNLINKIQAIADSLRDGEDGEDGEDGSPDSPEEVRDKLETLRGHERLSISAIDELPEILEELTKKLKERENTGGSNTPRVYGGGRIRFLDDQAFVGTIDGVNTVFKLIKTPATGSLKVYRNGARQRQGDTLSATTDYIFDGYRTVTFFTAPMSDRGDGQPETLFYDLRY